MYKKHLNLTLQCPEAMRGAMRCNRDDFEDYNPTETPTEKSLVRLHKRVIAASQAYQRTQCQWGVLVEKAFDLEDVALNETSAKHVFVRSFGSYSGMWKAVYPPTVGRFTSVVWLFICLSWTSV